MRRNPAHHWDGCTDAITLRPLCQRCSPDLCPLLALATTTAFSTEPSHAARTNLPAIVQCPTRAHISGMSVCQSRTYPPTDAHPIPRKPESLERMTPTRWGCPASGTDRQITDAHDPSVMVIPSALRIDSRAPAPVIRSCGGGDCPRTLPPSRVQCHSRAVPPAGR